MFTFIHEQNVKICDKHLFNMLSIILTLQNLIFLGPIIIQTHTRQPRTVPVPTQPRAYQTVMQISQKIKTSKYLDMDVDFYRDRCLYLKKPWRLCFILTIIFEPHFGNLIIRLIWFLLQTMKMARKTTMTRNTSWFTQYKHKRKSNGTWK